MPHNRLKNDHYSIHKVLDDYDDYDDEYTCLSARMADGSPGMSPPVPAPNGLRPPDRALCDHRTQPRHNGKLAGAVDICLPPEPPSPRVSTGKLMTWPLTPPPYKQHKCTPGGVKICLGL